MVKRAGIYKITIGEYFYFGQSRNLKSRGTNHLTCLRGQYHRNDMLQKVFNKYGEYHFEVIAHCPIEYLNKLEGHFVNKYYDDPRCMNLEKVDPEGVCSHTESSKRKISNAHSGKKLSEEHRQKLSESHMGKKLSREHRDSLSKAHKGRSKSPEHNKKVALGQPHRKKLTFIDPDGRYFCFPSQKQAMRELGIRDKLICKYENTDKLILMGKHKGWRVYRD